MATIKEIADRLGISISTVSKGLNAICLQSDFDFLEHFQRKNQVFKEKNGDE